ADDEQHRRGEHEEDEESQELARDVAIECTHQSAPAPAVAVRRRNGLVRNSFVVCTKSSKPPPRVVDVSRPIRESPHAASPRNAMFGSHGPTNGLIVPASPSASPPISEM